MSGAGRKIGLFFAGSFMMTLVFLMPSCGDDKTIGLDPLPFVRLVTGQKLESVKLGHPVKYSVLLPDGYDQSTETYPVVYLLHGYGDNESAWHTSGGIQFYADKYIAETGPMIYVMPQGYTTYYVDKYNGNYPYMEMFVDELVPEIDGKYRTKKDKTQRAVMGYSMGGYGALILPAMNPEVFTIGIPLSMSFRTDEQYLSETQGSFDNQWAPNFGPNRGANGEARLTNYFVTRSPFHFFNQDDLSSYSALKFLIDCGDDEESLSQTNDNLHMLMRDHNVAHEYRVRSGGHSFDYWKKGYPEALKFISNAMKGIEHSSEPEPVVIGSLINTNDYQQLTVAGRAINVLKPVDYESSTVNYPVLYFIHDSNDGDIEQNRRNVFSLLRNAITAGKLPKSIFVEIPSAMTSVNDETLTAIVNSVDASFRTKAERFARVLMGNGTGGNNAAGVVATTSNLFSDCFLLSAALADLPGSTATDVFYYLDITDDGQYYRGYHNLYMKIRKEGIEYEYRVRPGATSHQAFLNGLAESFSSLRESLNK